MKEKINKMNKSIIKIIKNNKKVSIILLSSFVIVITCVIVFLLLKNDTYAVEQENFIGITCPEVASGGEEIECSVTLTSSTVTTEGVSANFETSDDLIFQSFTASSGWTPYAADSEGIILVNLDGLTETEEIGKVKYKLPDNAPYSSNYEIKLVNVTISDGNESLSLDDASSTVRTLSDVNTLSSISLSNGSLNETFSSETNNYTATTNSDKITITTTKTDEHSTVSGDGQVNLHYGTNNVVIKVRSEAGNERNYTLSIFRTYDFESDKYIYNKNENYIYTRGDKTFDSILSNVEIPSELNSSVNNNKLMINYGEENILAINIINMYTDKYTIADDKIYVGKDVSYDTFSSNITLNGVTIKVLNGSTEVNSGVLAEGYKVAVYHGNNLLETYNVSEEYINFANNLVVDETNKIIKRLKAGTKYSEIIENNGIDTNGTITIKNGVDGATLTQNDIVKTGDIINISLSSGTKKYTVSVLGDVSGNENSSGVVFGDGQVTIGDSGVLYNYLKGRTTFTECQIAAGDILNDANIKINDVARLYRFKKGKHSTLEVE